MKVAFVVMRWICFACQFYGCLILSCGNPFLGIPFLVSSVLWIIPETATPIAEFFGECWAGLIFPNARFHKPPLSYTLADFYCKHHRHEDSVREHLQLLRHYPEERKSYLEVIAHCRALGANKMADRYEKRFRKRFGISKSRGISRKCTVLVEEPKRGGDDV